MVGGSEEGVLYFERGQLEVDAGEGGLKGREAWQVLGWRALHSARCVAGCSFQGLSPPSSIVFFSLTFLGTPSW